MSTKTKKLKRSQNLPFRPLPKGEHGGIELLLIHSVESLGKQGDVVEVRPGYAYNYLIPHGLGTVATDHHKRMVDKHKVKLQQIELQRQAELRKLAAEIGKQSITIEANATEDGHLYGSVGATEIAAALKSNDISLAAENIRLEGPLKELGL
jgi:large subunit ribosomal protein L9